MKSVVYGALVAILGVASFIAGSRHGSTAKRGGAEPTRPSFDPQNPPRPVKITTGGLTPEMQRRVLRIARTPNI